MDRTRVRNRRLALTLTAALVGAAWAGPLARAVVGGGQAEAASHRAYVVRHGDTLWSIAERLDPGADPRPLVDAISGANGIEAGALVPGQSLVIPPG